MTDVIIIGGGPAGLTAAIYARRAGLSVKIIERLAPGGQMATTPDIENYPAFRRVEGYKLSMEMESHARELGAEIIYKDVIAIDTLKKTVKFADGSLEARALILAMGAARRKIGCPGEKEFAGRGVSYCATCDGAFFKGKNVAVIGGGNTALEDALHLAGLGCKVYLVHRRNEFRGGKILEQSVRSNTNIELCLGQTVAEIKGGTVVESVALNNVLSGEQSFLNVAGVFAAVGVEPSTGLVKNQLKLTESGHIDCGEDCRTEIEGVFAAGDIRRKPLYQIVTACADGAVAATAVGKYIFD
ncbi:MAG: thioredoxin-disulfide reductase [Oscillospiraceae bacterium]|nr:thioredoxin-disulfide reductase [Oscillospiraceae bacterium]